MNDFILINTKIHKVDRPNSMFQLNDSWGLISNGKYQVFANADKQILIFGDYIGSENQLLSTPDDEIPKLRGNFYAIISGTKRLKVYSSFLNMLPLFHTIDNSLIGSSMLLIAEYYNQNLILDKKYILENLLFNYGFFNRTKYEQIKLVPTNHALEIENETVTIFRHFSINELFVSKQSQSKGSASEVSDLFIENVKHYLPDEHFDIAFTSGFDGRTLVSCAQYHKKNFSTFSFGRAENDDVAIPKQNAEELNIAYEHLDLNNDHYIEADFIKNTLAYGKSGYLGNGFLYAHFPYSAKKIMSRSKYVLSGACGSELFRALHNPGAVTSSALVDVFKNQNDQVIREKLMNSKVLQVLQSDEFITELDELINEIIAYKNQLSTGISMNQQFYCFVFEEIFRKFFGQWLVTQQNHVQVRTPFLDFKFVQKLLQTEFAGANNDFLTSNPFKRVKGQYIYADIIKKTNKKIYYQKTGKGYRPIDVRNVFYMGNIVFPFLKKKFTKKVAKPFLDNLGIISGVKRNENFLKDLISSSVLFNKEVLHRMLKDLTAFTPEKERDTLLMSISLLNNLLIHEKQQKQQLVEIK